jgi:hypothetical protein
LIWATLLFKEHNIDLKRVSIYTRHSQKITGKVGAVDYETTGVIYPRAKL